MNVAFEQNEKVDILKRRLKKTYIVAEKMKTNFIFEQNVSMELAKRNDLLKMELIELENKQNLMVNDFKILYEKISLYKIKINSSNILVPSSNLEIDDICDYFESFKLKYFTNLNFSSTSTIQANIKSRPHSSHFKGTKTRKASLLCIPESDGFSLFRKSTENDEINSGVNVNPSNRSESIENSSNVPLFEHFLMVGADPQVSLFCYFLLTDEHI